MSRLLSYDELMEAIKTGNIIVKPSDIFEQTRESREKPGEWIKRAELTCRKVMGRYPS